MLVMTEGAMCVCGTPAPCPLRLRGCVVDRGCCRGKTLLNDTDMSQFKRHTLRMIASKAQVTFTSFKRRMKLCCHNSNCGRNASSSVDWPTARTSGCQRTHLAISQKVFDRTTTSGILVAAKNSCACRKSAHDQPKVNRTVSRGADGPTHRL